MLDAYYYQHAYVTRDLDRAVETMSALYGMAFHCHETRTTFQSPAGIVPLAARIGIGWHGNLQYELIQPLSGYVDFYLERLAEDHAPRFHHIAGRVIDWERTQDDIAASGLPKVLSGEFDDFKFVYVDARHLVGHYLEYIWMTDARWAARAPAGVQAAQSAFSAAHALLSPTE